MAQFAKRSLAENVVLITTYSMLSYSGPRSNPRTIEVMNAIKAREWGLVVLDEVGVSSRSFSFAPWLVSRCMCGDGGIAMTDTPVISQTIDCTRTGAYCSG